MSPCHSPPRLEPDPGVSVVGLTVDEWKVAQARHEEFVLNEAKEKVGEFVDVGSPCLRGKRENTYGRHIYIYIWIHNSYQAKM